MSGRKSALKQLEQINLRAGRRQRVKIKVMDVNVTLAMCLCNPRFQQKHLVEALCALRAVFQHGSHRGIAVNVGVFALDIIFHCGLERQILIDFHESGVHLTLPRALLAIQNIRLRRFGVSLLNQDFFHRILYILYGRRLCRAVCLDIIRCIQRQTHRHLVVVSSGCLRSFIDGIRNLRHIKEHTSAISFFNLLYHRRRTSDFFILFRRKKHKIYTQRFFCTLYLVFHPTGTVSYCNTAIGRCQ